MIRVTLSHGAAGAAANRHHLYLAPLFLILIERVVDVRNISRRLMAFVDQRYLRHS